MASEQASRVAEGNKKNMTTLFTDKTMGSPLDGTIIKTFEQLVQALKEHFSNEVDVAVTLADVPSLEQLLLTFVAAPMIGDGESKAAFLAKCAEAYDTAKSGFVTSV